MNMQSQLDTHVILMKTMEAAGKASVRPWDAFDHGAVILASASYYLRNGSRFPALKVSTTHDFWTWPTMETRNAKASR